MSRVDPKKAKEILNTLHNDSITPYDPDHIDAIQVGIQAITYLERLCAMSLEIRKGWRRLQNPLIDNTRSQHHIKEVLESPPGREPRH